MSLHEISSDPLMAVLRARDLDFSIWIGELRANDPPFARASLLRPADDGEWQGAVYLLTGCPRAWAALGSQVMTEQSIAPVIEEIETGVRYFSTSELALLRWSAHLWNVYATDIRFPYEFDDDLLRRWLNACLLRRHTAPETAGTR